MIIFDLACGRNHTFEGWFGSAEDFASQRARHLVRCPVCDDADVAKRPSAVAVHVASGAPASAPTPAAGPSESNAVAAGLPPEIVALQRELLTRLREHIASTENVGTRFADEARKIHYEEAPKRSIRGVASKEDAESLRDEGIEFHPLPAFLTDDVH